MYEVQTFDMVITIPIQTFTKFRSILIFERDYIFSLSPREGDYRIENANQIWLILHAVD